MKENQKQPAKYLWQCMPDETALLLRVYAAEDILVLPNEIEGHAISAIGAYCFSDVERLPAEDIRENFSEIDSSGQNCLRLVAGSDLQCLELPDAVREIRDLAFYNCKNLRLLQLGKGTRKIGSDIFMNCHALHTIQIRGGVQESSGAAMFLQQLSSEIVVHFMGSESGSEAKLLYPEYLESYDEIAPAHIFGRNITGEGFRARQLFADGVVQLERYDEILDKVSAEESDLTVGRLALLRLLYPVALRQDKQDAYERQIRKYGCTVAKYYIDQHRLEVLQRMCECSYLQGKDLDEAIQYSVSVDWSEGSAALLDWKQRYGGTDRRNRYIF